MNNLRCSLNGHDLKVTRCITAAVKEYVCKNCKIEFTTSPDGDVTPLTAERKDTNRLLEHMYHKRQSRELVSFDIRSWIEAS